MVTADNTRAEHCGTVALSLAYLWFRV
uniref:Uncharacterized protein n=1 Tax=Anguilla anguilla TaxID=7936 RepID=A0A0E9V9N7_ANGAN